MKAAYAPTGKRSVAGTGTSTGSGSSGVEFKRIIASFCHVLVACKLVTPDCLIGPEQLRLAKFNQDGVSKNMWRLLIELLNYTKRSLLSMLLDTKEPNLAAKAPVHFDERNPVQVIGDVKREMRRLGYEASAFHRLEATVYESNASSRELLLAVGWLLSTFGIMSDLASRVLDQSAAQTSSAVMDDFFRDWMQNNEEARVTQSELAALKSDYESALQKNDGDDSGQSLCAQLNLIKCLEGRFKFHMSSYASGLREQARLVHRHQDSQVDAAAASEPPSQAIDDTELRRHLSRLECNLLLGDEQRFASYEQRVLEQAELHENLLVFVENEDLFWKWMKSVVDEKLKDEQKAGEAPSSRMANNEPSDDTGIYVHEAVESSERALASERRKYECALEAARAAQATSCPTDNAKSKGQRVSREVIEAQVTRELDAIVNTLDTAANSNNDNDDERCREFMASHLPLHRASLSRSSSANARSIRSETERLAERTALLKAKYEREREAALELCTSLFADKLTANGLALVTLGNRQPLPKQ